MIYDQGGLSECFNVFHRLSEKGDFDFEKGIL